MKKLRRQGGLRDIYPFFRDFKIIFRVINRQPLQSATPELKAVGKLLGGYRQFDGGRWILVLGNSRWGDCDR